LNDIMIEQDKKSYHYIVQSFPSLILLRGKTLLLSWFLANF
jgi:hypothetical protein